MNNYKIIRNLGDGSFGSVKQASIKSTGELVAIKKLNQKFYSWEECLELREIKVLRKTVHPNIVKLKEAVRVNDDLYLVFEFCEKNIFTFIKETPEIEEQRIREIIKEMLQGLSELHRNGFIHRDIKPENILMHNNVCKLADFGLAKEIRCQPPFTEYVSTRWYRAPEIILKSRRYSWQIDMFAVGLIMIELYTRAPLFPGSSELDQLNRYCTVLGSPYEWAEGARLASQMNFSFPNSAGIHLSQIIPAACSEAVEFLYTLLAWDPRMRPTADVCLQHPFFHKRNLSSNNPGLSPPQYKEMSFNHSSSSNNLSIPGPRPQVFHRNDGLRKIGANILGDFRSRN